MANTTARTDMDSENRGRGGAASLRVLPGGRSSAAPRSEPRNSRERLETVERFVCAGQDIPASSTDALAAFKVKSGWVATYSMLEDGRRQFIYLYLRGDIVLIHAGALAGEGHCVTALTDAVIESIPVAAPFGADSPHTGSLDGWIGYLMRERSILSERIVSLGRRTAYERTAHLLVELCARLDPEGWDFNSDTELPVTQEILADLLGLSLVHVNRTLRRLRQDGHVSTGNRCIVVHNPADLVEPAGMEVDPALYSQRRTGEIAH